MTTSDGIQTLITKTKTLKHLCVVSQSYEDACKLRDMEKILLDPISEETLIDLKKEFNSLESEILKKTVLHHLNNSTKNLNAIINLKDIPNEEEIKSLLKEILERLEALYKLQSTEVPQQPKIS